MKFGHPRFSKTLFTQYHINTKVRYRWQPIAMQDMKVPNLVYHNILATSRKSDVKNS